MTPSAFLGERLRHSGLAAKWLAIILPVAATVGTLCAAFLWALDRVTEIRFDNPALLFALPLAGVAVGLVYHWVGRPAEGGNNLIVEQIHQPGGGVPLRMAPLILVSTIVSHLFGASVGREGTAVQVGGSIAGGVAKALFLKPDEVRILLMVGIAAGFGAVFGTPIAGAVFALEVLTVGRVEYTALVPAVLAAIVADYTCHAWGVTHIAYHLGFAGYAEAGVTAFHIDPVLLAKVAVAGVAFGLCSLLFSELAHRVGGLAKRLCPVAWLRPAIGGVLIIALVYATGSRDYLGLGVISPEPGGASIVNFFGPAHYGWAWAWKIAFTVLALATGFKGGEVTPLFFIGAALGNALSAPLNAPVDLMAALGFVALFAGAANTPLACTLMGIELFGAANTAYIATACFVAYLCSGHSGIYLSQRIGVPKTRIPRLPPNASLRHARDLHPVLWKWRSPSAGAAADGTKLTPAISRTAQDDTPMHTAHDLTSKEIGMIRIYMKPREKYRRHAGIRGALSSRPLFRELVLRAKQAGLVNATAHHTHFGFSNHGAVQEPMAEISNPELTMCVEMIGPRDTLERFCRDHGAVLENKVIVYKHLEHWHVRGGAGGAVRLQEEAVANPGELLAPQ